MLCRLKVTNLAIIDEVEVEFQKGFNVLTGETGAGKSILLGALNLLLAAKASSDMIRADESEAVVEGLFEIEDPKVLPEEMAPDLKKNSEIVLARRIFSNGRSRCYINGSLATLSLMGSVGRSLVSIFGQHEHQALLDSDEHVEILDRHGGNLKLKKMVSEAYNAWKSAERELKGAQAQLAELKAAEAENQAALEELTAADLREDEEDELTGERELMGKAAQIREKAFEGHQTLYAGSGSVLERLADVRKGIDFLISVNPALSNLSENMDEAVYRLEDVAMELREVAQESHFDPVKMERIEERLGLIRRLKRKHGMDLGGLIEYREELNHEAGATLDVVSKVKKLQTEVDLKETDYFKRADELTKARKKAAKSLEKAMSKELKDLAMPQARFSVDIQPLEKEKITPGGQEKVEFQLAANPGEASLPLARVASGGELSRIMLAIKALQVYRESAGTVIFDEVDAGIGGHTAKAVGSRLADVSRKQQLLCITHLHQIAALADHHLFVQKRVKDTRTRIEVSTLNDNSRVEELTRMLGAGPDSDSAREHVKRMMQEKRLEVTG